MAEQKFEAFTGMPLKKFVITHKSLKKLTAHECHHSELLCSPSHSIGVLFVFHRLRVLTSGQVSQNIHNTPLIPILSLKLDLSSRACGRGGARPRPRPRPPG